MCEWCGHNVREVPIMCECGDVRVEMCEWSGDNVRVNMECASRPTVMCE